MGKPIKRMTDDELAEAIERTRKREERLALDRLHKLGFFDRYVKVPEAETIFRKMVAQAEAEGLPKSTLAKMQDEQAARRKAAAAAAKPWKALSISRATYYRRQKAARARGAVDQAPD